mgnify:CR=1 FL=1
MSIYEKLLKVQQDTKCNKGQFNSFGKYKYRSMEDIWAAAKPIAASYGAVLTCTDKPILIGDRYYIEATATIYDIEDGTSISTTASAREDDAKKGMDGSQITGTASSYARKYAVSGLLGLDDTKDADTDSYKREVDARAEEAETSTDTSETLRKKILEVAEMKGIAQEQITGANYNGKTWDELSREELVDVKVKLGKRKDR